MAATLLSVLLAAVSIFPTVALSPTASSLCPNGQAQMAVMNYTTEGQQYAVVVCEQLGSRNGCLSFKSFDQKTSGPFPIEICKRVSNITARDDDEYLNYTKAQVLTAKTDVLGELLLREGDDPSLARVTEAIPPLRSINGARVWTANRESGRDATFDSQGSNRVAGTPSPEQAGKVLTGLASPSFDHEGLLGGELPIPVLNFPTKDANTTLWEMSVVPVPNHTGTSPSL